MRLKNLSDGVLVYDRYYGSKPHAALLVLKRLLLCCALSVCSMMFILTNYAFGTSLALAAAFTALFSAVFFLLFSFFRKRVVIPLLIIAAAIFVRARYLWLWERLSYFADAAMMLTDGRFVDPRGLLFHKEQLVSAADPDYIAGVTLGSVLLCAVFSFVCAASLSRRPRVMPPVIMLSLLCAPRIISEMLEFNIWLVPTLGLLGAAASLSACYSGGLAVKHSSSSHYRRVVSDEERTFLRNADRAGFIKRAKMNTGYYSKYFSVGMYCAALFASAGLVASSLFGMGSSIDYSGVYRFIMELGGDAGITASPFEEGPVSEYFTDSDVLAEDKHLNIVSPGTGEQEIIRVTTDADVPLYLRGDIGIDFEGTSWTSPINDEPPRWERSGLKREYRPCEMRVAHSLFTAKGLEPSDCISQASVTIDYLCETSVVFLPPYTAEYSYLVNDRFNVYGDTVVRVNGDFGVVNTVQCTALIPHYTNTEIDDHSGGKVIRQIEDEFADSLCTVNTIYQTVVPEMAGTENVFERYAAFADDTYLGIPDEYIGEIKDFIEKSGLDPNSTYIPWDASNAVDRYLAARNVADYLRENYTYSLSAQNREDDPVMSFLNETHSGHCSLYASAMTLIVRAMGIPARYCTGFMAEPSDSGVSVLKAKNLHAWCEVYIGDLGWVTFDPTASSVFSSAPGDTGTSEPARPKPAPQSHTQSERDPAPVTSTLPLSDPPAVPQPVENKIDPAPYIAAGAGVLLLVSLAAITVYYLYRRKKRAESAVEGMKRGDPAAACEIIYRKMLDILTLAEFTPQKGELPEKFYARADKRFGTDLAAADKTLEALAFGHYAASEEERAILAEQYEKLFRSARKAFGVIRRMKLYSLVQK